MKNLKLEVGKTYFNRKRESVKIVKKIILTAYPFKGDNGFTFMETGEFESPSKRSDQDLIAEAPTAQPEKRTFKIPENTREISVSETDGRIVIEFVPELKKGDVCINERGTVYIFKEDDGDRFHQVCGGILRGGELVPQVGGCVYGGRLATSAEAQQLFDALAKDGKQWNAEKLKIEELTERDRIRAWMKSEGWPAIESEVTMVYEYVKHREAQPCK